ncbi:MAG: GIY-YIG nuclease family protein [Patescibacteria group bacterium]|nr:GIY-YIG nuclease family protein [Patescibacteria group bacterium]
MNTGVNSSIIAALPTAPGVYFFKDAARSILYIGKAANIRARVRSHFGQNMAALHPSRGRLYAEVARIDYKETGSEIEALVLEALLIKKHQPPYNVALRDDKNYFFVGLTKAAYPKVFMTHQPEQNQTANSKDQKASGDQKGRAAYIGPFTSGRALRETLRLLQKIFPYCTCTETHKRPCMRFQLERCPGICCLKAERLAQYETLLIGPGRTLESKKREYRRNIKNIKTILEGRSPRLLKTMKREMTEAARRRQFEEAGKLRDQIAALEWTLAHARVLTSAAPTPEDVAPDAGGAALAALLGLARTPRRIEAYDISNIQGKFAVGSMIVFENGAPKKSDYRKFRIRTVAGANDIAMHTEMLTRRFKHPEWPLPDAIIVDGGLAQVNAATQAIEMPRNERTLNPVVLGFTKGPGHKGDHLTLSDRRTIPVAELSEPLRNLLTHLDNEAHRFAIQYYRKVHRKQSLP